MSVSVASSFNPEIPSIHGTNMLGTLQARDDQLFTTGDDSDDDLPVITKKKKAILRLTDSDDEGDEGNQPGAPADTDKDKSESESEEQDQSQGAGKGKKRIAKLFDDSDDEDAGTESKTEMETEEDNNEAAEMGRKKTPKLFDSDDEDELTEGHGKNDSDEEAGDAEDGEEEEGNKEMSDALKKRLAKGAAKKTKNSQKKEKEEVRQIHSETQRIIRESAVRIPYHMPKPKALSEFLARTKEKQAKIKEFSTRLALNKHKDPIKLTGSSQQKTSPNSIKRMVSGEKQKSPTESRAQMVSGEETPPDSEVQVAGGPENIDSGEGEKKTLTNTQELDLGENELPDLGNVGNKVENRINQENTAELEMNDVSCKNQEQMDSVNEADDSGPLSDMTNIVNMTDTELNPTVDDGVKGSETSEIRDKDQNTDTDAEKDSGISPTKKSLKEKLAEKLKSLTPKLSGGPEDMIDLEGDSGIASGKSMAPGMKDLMTRLVLHSARRKKKKARDVEISVVKKDQVSENREELKLEKVTVHLDEEPEEEPKNLPPGGRWNQIKEKLTAEMRAKREESRQRRQEVYDLDNEEGFQARMEEEKEEEAELTDQTETDVSDEEGDGWDEEDYLEEEEEDEGMLEDKPRKKSAFVDGEAEEDGDDEEEEDAGEQGDEMMDEGEIEDEDLKLHLAGSDCEDDGSVGMDTASERVSPTESLEVPISSGMKKASSIHLDVLDEDAISQSPLSSAPDAAKQDCESTDVVGDRPFQQLSQGKEVENTVLQQLSQGKEAEKTGLQKELSDQNTTMTDFLSERDGSLLSADNSFDLMGSLIPAGQGHRKSQRDTPEIFSPTSKQSTGTEGTSTSCSTKRLCDITLPIEDSQLFMTNPPKGDTMSTDTESNWLDEEGFLKPAKRELCLGGTESSTQENMDELLGLCSGKFTGDGTETQKSDEAASFGFASQLKNTQSQMDELLGLCSGQFTESTQKDSSGADTVKPFRTQTKPFTGFPGLHSNTQSSSNTQSNMDELLGLCSGTFRTSSPAPEDSPAKPTQTGRRKKRKALMISDDEDDVMLGDEADTGKRIDQALGEQDASESDGDNMEEEDELDPEEAEQIQKFTGFKTKKGKLRREFVDEEAELSGSEYDSDENLDIAAKDDVMEEEEGDKVDLGMTEEELRDQVGKVHLKSLIDEDKRKLLLYQEMYLPDGDLHSEGGGRSRKFRWKNIDEDTQGDMFANGSDDEQNEEENENETKWRLERYEREKFLQEQKAKEEAEETDSQLLKLGKSVFKPQRSLKKSIQPKPSTKPQEPPSAESETNTSMKAPKTTPRQSSTTASPASLKRRGSLLCRSKDSLDRIAMLSKPVTNPNGARHSRNFVFAALSPDAKPKPEMKRSTSKMEPPAKKPKVERSSSLPAGSIFKLM